MQFGPSNKMGVLEVAWPHYMLILFVSKQEMTSDIRAFEVK